MSFDLSLLDKYVQKFVRSGTSLFIRTFHKETDALVHEFEFTSDPSQPVPEEVSYVSRAILAGIAMQTPVQNLEGLISPSGGIVKAERGGFRTFDIFGSSSTYYCWTTDLVGGSCVSYAVRLVQKCAGALWWVGGSGISGETSADQIDRLPAYLASRSIVPTYTVLQIAGNDVTSTTDLATVQARIVSMCIMVLKTGSIPILLAPNVLGTGYGATANQILRHGFICEVMRGLARMNSSILYADGTRFVGDTTSITYGAISGYLRADNLHTTNVGADAVSNALYEAVYHDIAGAKAGAAMPGMLYDATYNPYGNLLPNPFLNGSSGTAAGTNIVIGTNIIGNIPTNMVLRHTAGTGTCTITSVARTDGRPGYWKQFAFALTASENWAFNFIPSVSPGANKTLFGEMETQIDTSGITGGYIYTCSARMRDGGASKTVWEAGNIGGATNSESAEPVGPLRDVFRRVNPYTYSAFGSTGSLTYEFIGSSSLAGSLIVRVASVGLYNVNPVSI